MFFLVHRLVSVGDDAFAIVTFVEFGDANAAAYRDRGTAKIDKMLIEHPFDLFGPADSYLTLHLARRMANSSLPMRATLSFSQICNCNSWPMVRSSGRRPDRHRHH